MGKEATEIGYEENALVTQVAATLKGTRMFAGLNDGRVWSADTHQVGIDMLKAEKGPPISALAVSPDGRRVAWGDEEGQAGAGDA